VNNIETTIDGVKLNYQVDGEGRPVLLLHGWGASAASFAQVHSHLAGRMKAYSLDLPGFGLSSPPPAAWGTEEYAALVEKFVQGEIGAKPILIGHSFGGRLGIRLAAQGKVRKLVLVDAAGIKPKRSWRYHARVYSYKMLKQLVKLPLLARHGEEILERRRRATGSDDYRNASGVMRQTMVRVVNEDLTPLLPKINVPTLLVWGEMDTATPLADGQLMEKLIPGAGLVVFKNSGHYSYLENMGQFLRVLDSFFAREMEAADE